MEGYTFVTLFTFKVLNWGFLLVCLLAYLLHFIHACIEWWTFKNPALKGTYFYISRTDTCEEYVVSQLNNGVLIEVLWIFLAFAFHITLSNLENRTAILELRACRKWCRHEIAKQNIHLLLSGSWPVGWPWQPLLCTPRMLCVASRFTRGFFVMDLV